MVNKYQLFGLGRHSWLSFECGHMRPPPALRWIVRLVREVLLHKRLLRWIAYLSMLLHSLKEWQCPDGCRNVFAPPTRVNDARPPPYSLHLTPQYAIATREIHISRRCTSLRNWRYQVPWPKHELVLYLARPCHRIGRKFVP